MTLKLRTKLWLCGVLIVAPLSFAQAGESGWVLGGSVGSAVIEAEVTDDPNVPPFDEDDFAWKVFLGYNFGLTPVFNLGIEGGYVSLGSPSADIAGETLKLELAGIDLFGVIGFDIGPVGLFGKVGYVSWDVEGIVDGITVINDDGSDVAYGVGLRFNLASMEIRGEYEIFDIEDSDNVAMYSLGVAYHFN